MDTALLGLAFAAGTLAAVNPCGFALLPAYLSLFVSAPEPDGARGAHAVRVLGPLRRAAQATAAMTAGFVLVFGSFGLLVAPFALSIERWLPWATIVIGVGLLALGIALALGRELKIRGPKIAGRGDPTASATAMGAYGVSFAVASLSCTVGPFLAVTTTAFRDGSLLGIVGAFLAYAAGMGAVVGVLTVAAALSRDSLVRRMRAALPYVSRVGGGLLILAGAYAAWYGWYEVRILRGDRVEDPIVDTATAWQSQIARFVADLPVAWIGVALLVLLALTAGRSGVRTVLIRSGRGREPAAHPGAGVDRQIRDGADLG
ncbi:MAG: cytochrome c biogenesis CcdA family protein [Sporichthyaceae bacterium]